MSMTTRQSGDAVLSTSNASTTMAKSSKLGSYSTRVTVNAVVPTAKDVISDSEDERVVVPAAASSTRATTPSNRKRRRMDDDDQQQEPHIQSAVKIIVTPTKEPTFASYLPTPPITPLLQTTAEDASPLASASNSSNVYARARACLRLAANRDDQPLVGRDIEQQQLDRFLAAHFISGNAESADTPKALYISGSPGTGKTALLSATLAKFRSQHADTSVSFINCAALRDADDIWNNLADDLKLLRSAGKGEARQRKFDEAAFAHAVFHDASKRSLVMLDEVDHLLFANGAASRILTSLFRLALDPASTIVLVGIANALDLSERHLAMLSAGEHKHSPKFPQLLHFRPFQSDEMVLVAKARLLRLNNNSEFDNQAKVSLPIFMPPALELAAKKVSAVTGDLRAFLSLIRKAVEIIEQEQRKRLVTAQDAAVSSSPSSKKRSRAAKIGSKDNDPLLALTYGTAPKVSPAHILKATRAVSLITSPSGNSGSSSLSASSNSSSQISAKIADLNLQARIALLSFIVAVERTSSAPFTSATDALSTSMKPLDVYSIYRVLLQKEDIFQPVSSGEFGDLVAGLHTRGLVGSHREQQARSPSPRSSISSPSDSLLAPPMMRRTSSSSSTGSSRSRSSSPSAAQSPLVLLYTPYELAASLKSTAPAEAASICTSMLAKEEKSIRRKRMMWERAEAERGERQNAPTEGFHGDGLDDVNIQLVGKRDKRGINDAEDAEEGSHGDGDALDDEYDVSL